MTRQQAAPFFGSGLPSFVPCTLATCRARLRHDDKIGRITAKPTSYRIVFDLFSMNCKSSRLNLCRKINLVRHGLSVSVVDETGYKSQ